MEYLDIEVNSFHREDYYLAQIAAEIRRGNVKDPEKVSVEGMKLKFRLTNEVKKKPPPTCEQSKSFWKALIGFSKKQEKR